MASRRSFIAVSGLGALAGLASRGASAASPQLPLTPQVTEGPFYLDVGLVRSDITEGAAGVPLDVRLRVVDVTDTPLRGCRVDLWHCDASGWYSGFAGQGPNRETNMRGRTFLRGSMPSDDDGIAAFRTIYPGWYAGRTTHIHLKVFHRDRVVLTSQLFLPDALSEYLYTNLSAYRRATLRDTLNRRDGIALEAGDAAVGAVREEADRYVVSATTVVDPQARPRAEGPPDRRAPRGGPDGPAGRPHLPAGNRDVPGSFDAGAFDRGPGRPDDRPPPGRDGPPPRDRGPVAALRGEERVAAIVPGGAR